MCRSIYLMYVNCCIKSLAFKWNTKHSFALYLLAVSSALDVSANAMALSANWNIAKSKLSR